MGVMGARRLVLGVLVSVCTLGCVLVVGVGSAWAAGGSFFFGPPGEEAGQIRDASRSPYGMAVDGANGDVYVSDGQDNRVEKFSESGEFLLAWGAGSLSIPAGVAVDQGSGDVYVVDTSDRVQKFDSSGKFLLMFGGHVNANGSDVCTAAEVTACRAGMQGEGDGEFDWVFEKSNIAVGPGGDVYVGDKARVQVFEPSGAWKENISLSALSSVGKVTALAVGASGDVLVKDEGVPGVRAFEPPLWLEAPVKFDEGSEAVESIAVDAAGHVFVSEREGGYFEEGYFVPCSRCDFVEYGSSGVELESFGDGTFEYMTTAMAYDEALGDVLSYGYGLGGEASAGVWEFPVPPSGPLVEAGSEKATPELRGAATLEALVNPEGSSTEVGFEYVDEADFKASGYASASSTAPVMLAGLGFSGEHVVVNLPQKTLIPGVTYHWRVAAHNSQGSNPGVDQSFEETQSALVEGPWTSSVTASSVTLEAKIDPLGANTSYRLEYGTSASYGHVFSGNVGEGMGYVQIGYHVQELQAQTVYHYRVVTTSEVGTIEGVDHTFTTQSVGGALGLPDGRAWELVSPPDKGGALIEDIERSQAASDGSAIVYSASEPLGEGIVGHVGSNAQVLAGATLLSRRGAAGWSTRDISPQQTLPPEGESAASLSGAAEAFMTFSQDLSLGVLEPRFGLGHTAQSPEAGEPSLYVRDNIDETYEPLVTAANVPPGTKWAPERYRQNWEEMSFEAATPDLSHILIGDWAALTPEAITEKSGDFNGEHYTSNLYEWSSGQLQLVNIVPNEETMREEPKPGVYFSTNSVEGGVGAGTPWAMSGDGRWIVFHYGDLPDETWYVRDMVGHRTVRFGRPGGKTKFETMSRDGSRLFYLEPSGEQEQEGELYMLDPASGVTTDLTADHLGGESSAGVRDKLVGISEDGSYVYFVATGVLADGAVSGRDNFYVMHEAGGEWKTTFIATLSGDDEKDWNRPESEYKQLAGITSRVTPDGRYVTFMSDRPLTGYDNIDAISGQPDEEVYLYDAETNRLVCASCNPTGARPIGVHDVQNVKGVLMDESGAWDGDEESGYYKTHGHWLAASIAPGWHVNWYAATHRVSYLSDSGRLFFNSSDALVPQDTNGLADVYEYELPGVGDCTSASVTFSERSGGCVSLISSGQSSSESTFLEASENGDDVFFITAAKLVSEDYDTANDVYDAHVCSTAVPCRTVPVSPPACTSGDSCKAAPSPQPEIFGPAPSATFNGAGNVIEEAKKAVVKRKAAKPKHVKPKKRKRKGRKARRSRTAGTSGKGGRR